MAQALRCRCDKAECTRLRRSASGQQAPGAHSMARGHPLGRLSSDPESSMILCPASAAARVDNETLRRKARQTRIQTELRDCACAASRRWYCKRIG
ncbi:hypothetical protein MRX96_012364 [Rhipicephalus microplus]